MYTQRSLKLKGTSQKSDSANMGGLFLPVIVLFYPDFVFTGEQNLPYGRLKYFNLESTPKSHPAGRCYPITNIAIIVYVCYTMS